MNYTNEYAKVAEIINNQNVNGLINTMHELTRERLMHSTRKRILNEIALLENQSNELQRYGEETVSNYYVPFSDQLELINELFEYGFIADVKQCLDIMLNRIAETQPELLEWFKINKERFGFKVNGPTKGQQYDKVFLERFHIVDDFIHVNFCANSTWKEACFKVSDLLYMMKEENYDYLFTDMEAPLPLDLFETSVKTQLATYILENTEKLVKQYIMLGYETTEV